jgi:hypothetical protein
MHLGDQYSPQKHNPCVQAHHTTMMSNEYAHGATRQAPRDRFVHKIRHGQMCRHTPCLQKVEGQLEVWTKLGWVTADDECCRESVVSGAHVAPHVVVIVKAHMQYGQAARKSPCGPIE